MNINNGREDCIIGEKGIEHFEKKYNAIYVSDLCLKTVDGSWAESPACIFYQPNPQPGHKDGTVYIDGGRDYTKNNNPDKLINLIIVDGKIKVVGQLEDNLDTHKTFKM